jgi:hypothetical protein
MAPEIYLVICAINTAPQGILRMAINGTPLMGARETRQKPIEKTRNFLSTYTGNRYLLMNITNFP